MLEAKQAISLTVLTFGLWASQHDNLPAQQQVHLPMRTSGAQKIHGKNSDVGIVGRWEWTIKIGSSGGKVAMDVKRQAQKLSAVVTTPKGENIQPKVFEVKDGKVRLLMERKRGLLTFTMTHAGVLKGDRIEGEFKVSGGPVSKKGKWVAKRVYQKKYEGVTRND